MSEALPDWASAPAIDLNTPSPARMYDYYLGGAHNFAVDREMASKVLQLFPNTPLIIQANRAFLHRAVRYLTAQGIRQFIDIGSGIPTEGNVHEVARAAAGGEEVRVLYVDHDPVAVVHSELLLGDTPGVDVLRGDLRRPEQILDSPQCRGLIDLSRPVAVLMVAVLHFVPEDEHPERIIGEFRAAVAPGSHLVISHGTPGPMPEKAEQVTDLYRSSADPTTLRSPARVSEFFAGWDLVEPGVTWVSQWHPDWPDEVGADPAANAMVAGVAAKPAA